MMVFFLLIGFGSIILIIICWVCFVNNKEYKRIHTLLKATKKIKPPFTRSQYFFNTQSQKKLDNCVINLLKSNCILKPSQQNKQLSQIAKLFFKNKSHQTCEIGLSIAFNPKNEIINYYWETQEQEGKIKLDMYRFYNFYFSNNTPRNTIYTIHNHPSLICIPSYADLTNFYKGADLYPELKTLIINENGEILDVNKMIESGLCYDPTKIKKPLTIMWPSSKTKEL